MIDHATNTPRVTPLRGVRSAGYGPKGSAGLKGGGVVTKTIRTNFRPAFPFLDLLPLTDALHELYTIWHKIIFQKWAKRDSNPRLRASETRALNPLSYKPFTQSINFYAKLIRRSFATITPPYQNEPYGVLGDI